MSEGLTVCYMGNFGPSHSTESHIARSLEALGHRVIRIQEGETPALEVPELCKTADVFMHTQTYGLAVTSGTIEEREQARVRIMSLGIPSVFFHLDLWHGLARADQLYTDPEPWTRYDYVFTTDGGHDEEWKQLGINHFWMAPGVFHEEAYDALPNPRRWPGRVAFCGSHRSYAHQEHEPVRMAMLNAMRKKFGRQFVCYPQRQAVRGPDLNELYATIPVIIGDSCLAGKIRGYVSDRCTETTGRGGFLIHPYVPGILNILPDLVTYPAEDWNALTDRVQHYLNNPVAREENRRMNSAWTREHHTYKVRMKTILEVVGLV